jgi:antitoxin (DNA-binding transcriptional repressor) of toxin-antitoxin stability system
MVVTITQFRQQLFALVERAAKGETVEFLHKEQRFRLVPETATSKLGRIGPLDIINHDSNISSDSQRLLDEMQAEWHQDWSEIA